MTTERCGGTPGKPYWTPQHTKAWHPYCELCHQGVPCISCPGCPDCAPDKFCLCEKELCAVPSAELPEHLDLFGGNEETHDIYMALCEDSKAVQVRIAELEEEKHKLTLALYEADDKLDYIGVQLGLWGWSDPKKTMLQAMQDGFGQLREETAALKAALEEILTTQGKVCPDFELCKHESCTSSYASWAIADATLHAHKP